MATMIAQVTDLHLDDFMTRDAGVDGRRNVARILEDVEKRGIVDLVLTGDIGEVDSHQWLMESISMHNLNPLFTLGNHDDLADFRRLEAVSDFVKPDGLYYSLDMEGVSCIFMDSSRGYVGDRQLSWLDHTLEHAERTVALFIHHPVLDCGTILDLLYPLQNRDRVREVLSESEKHISIFCGHYHTSHRQNVGNLSQYVTSSAVLQIKQHSDKVETESADYGYRIIRLSPDNISTEGVLFP